MKQPISAQTSSSINNLFKTGAVKSGDLFKFSLDTSNPSSEHISDVLFGYKWYAFCKQLNTTISFRLKRETRIIVINPNTWLLLNYKNQVQRVSGLIKLGDVEVEGEDLLEIQLNDESYLLLNFGNIFQHDY
jgi:hypothetical protein